MTRDLDEFSVQEYRDLIETVRRTEFWFPDPDFADSGIEEVAKKAAEGRFSSEYRFRHGVTDGVLYLRLPELGSPPLVLKGLLEQPFDKGLGLESCFARRLGEAHSVLAGKSSNPYVSPVECPDTVLSLDIPTVFDLGTVCKAAMFAGRVSLQVESLHQEIRRPVDVLLEDGLRE